MPKIDSLDIAFEKNDLIFHAGDRVRGAVVMTLREEMPILKITLAIKGESRNGWVNKTSDKIYESMEIYVNETIPIFDNPSDIPPGRHPIPFLFSLPVHLPSSFEGEFGRIRYTVHATVVTGSTRQTSSGLSSSGSGEVSCDRMIMLISNLNLMHYPLTRHPVEAEDMIDYTCCCVPLGSAQAVVKIPKNGFMPRENITIDAEIRNHSRRNLELITVTLIQNAKFYAWSRYENAPDTKEMRYCVASFNKPGARARRNTRIDQQVIEIPMVIPTYRGNIMEISYVLRFEANPGIEIEIPITIGTMDL